MKKALLMGLVASSFALSAVARADSLPPGAFRFNRLQGSFTPIDVPAGSTLVITDVVMRDNGYCELRDGDVVKLFVQSSVHLQTGIDFTTQVRSVDCRFFSMISGYWLTGQ